MIGTIERIGVGVVIVGVGVGGGVVGQMVCGRSRTGARIGAA